MNKNYTLIENWNEFMDGDEPSKNLNEDLIKQLVQNSLDNNFEGLDLVNVDYDNELIIINFKDDKGNNYKAVIRKPDYRNDEELSYDIYNAIDTELNSLDEAIYPGQVAIDNFNTNVTEDECRQYCERIHGEDSFRGYKDLGMTVAIYYKGYGPMEREFDVLKTAIKADLDECMLTEDPDIFGIDTDAEIQARADAEKKAAYEKRSSYIDKDALVLLHNYDMLDKMATKPTLAAKRQYIIDRARKELTDARRPGNRNFIRRDEYVNKPVDEDMLERLADYILDYYKNEDGVRFIRVNNGVNAFHYIDANGKQVMNYEKPCMQDEPDKYVLRKDAAPLTEEILDEDDDYKYNIRMLITEEPYKSVEEAEKDILKYLHVTEDEIEIVKEYIAQEFDKIKR